MSSYYAKPENALRKATDLVAVGQPIQAMHTLHRILSARRYRTWKPTHEKILKKYVDLAVLHRRNMKDALVQYRMLCQNGNWSSMETVMTYYKTTALKYLEDAEKKTAELGASKEALEADRDDDEEEEEAPEILLMKAVTWDDRQSTTDHKVLTPWLKYTREVYRTILDVLRNNGKLLEFYHNTVREAFQFCLRFKRQSAFRRLCDVLRQHLKTIMNYSSQTNSVDLTSPETQRLYLATRFQQLDVATRLELWQEAYRTIEDIHDNMSMTEADLEPSLMRTYYEKLADIFFASGNELFHAYSMERFYQLQVEAGALTPEERTRLASAVVLSTLAIPPATHIGMDDDDDETLMDTTDEGNLRLAAMLGFEKEVPTRSKLLNSLIASGLVGDTLPEVRQICNLLQGGFSPLTLNKSLTPLFVELQTEDNKTVLGKYVSPLQDLEVVRLCQQLSRVYHTLSLKKFFSLCPELPTRRIEHVLMQAAHKDQIRLQIDHVRGLLVFADPDMDSEQMRSQLNTLAARLAAVVAKIEPPSTEKMANVRKQVFSLIRQGMVDDHKEIHTRKREIEQFKQMSEQKQQQRHSRLVAAQRAAKQKRIQEERKRLEEEAKRRDEERIAREKKRDELLAKKKLAAEIQTTIEEKLQGTKLEKAAKKIQQLTENVEEVDRETLLQARMDVLQKEQEEKKRVERDRAKRQDYFVRALVEEERPRLIEAVKKQREQDRELYQAQYAEYVKQQKAIHERALAEKKRLSRLAAHAQEFKKQILERRQAEFEAARDEQKKRLEQLREERRREYVREKREELARIREEERQAELERKREEEEKLRREREEEEARKKEEAKKERQRKLDELAAKQRQRELELEEADRKRRQGLGSSGSGSYQPPQRSAAAGGSYQPPGRRAAGGPPDTGRTWRRNEPARRPANEPMRRPANEPLRRPANEPVRRSQADTGQWRRGGAAPARPAQSGFSNRGSSNAAWSSGNARTGSRPTSGDRSGAWVPPNRRRQQQQAPQQPASSQPVRRGVSTAAPSSAGPIMDPPAADEKDDQGFTIVKKGKRRNK